MRITLGKGMGAEEAIKSLAHSMVTSIAISKLDYIMFVMMEENRTGTITEIKKQCLELPANKLVLIRDTNDVNGLYIEKEVCK